MWKVQTQCLKKLALWHYVTACHWSSHLPRIMHHQSYSSHYVRALQWFWCAQSMILKHLKLVFASPVYRTGNIHRTELDWTTVWSFLVAVAHIWGQFSCQLPCFCRHLKTEKDWSFIPSHVGLYSHTYLLNFWSLNHQKWSRISWDMAKNIFVCIFCCKFTWPIIILPTAIWHHKNNNNMLNHLYHVILSI